MKTLGKFIGFALLLAGLAGTLADLPYSIPFGVLTMLTAVLLIKPDLFFRFSRSKKLYVFTICLMVFFVIPLSTVLIPESPSFTVSSGEGYEVVDGRVEAFASKIDLNLVLTNSEAISVNGENEIITEGKTSYTTQLQERQNTLELTLTGPKDTSTTKTLTIEYITPEMKAERDKDRGQARLAKEAEEQALAEQRSKAQRTELIHSQFSSLNGSHRGLVKVVKEGMNDPSSFEHVETHFMDRGKHIFVRMTFRGNNAFGGKVKNQVSANVGFEGNVIQILQ